MNEVHLKGVQLIDFVNDRMPPASMGFASGQRQGDKRKTMGQLINANEPFLRL